MAQTREFVVRWQGLARSVLSSVKQGCWQLNLLSSGFAPLLLSFSVAILSVGINSVSAGELRSSAIAQQSYPSLTGLQSTQNQPSPGLRALLLGKSLPGAVSSRTPSSIRLSIPSLWWISDQLAALDVYGTKFIQDWIAYPQQGSQPGQVDLLVGRQQWSLVDYLQRYEFVFKFSATARSYGYNTRVYDNPDRLPVASYVCDFSRDEIQALRSPSRLVPAAQLQPSQGIRSQIANSLTCNLNVAGLTNLLRK